ncbi:MAG: hypothetical protein KBD21_00105 [Candidatus Pacebacteria bacterium]|nr:hypothetical protein [Candidatus Paceibacterota bacterium]
MHHDRLAGYAALPVQRPEHLCAPQTDKEQAHLLCASYGILCLEYATGIGRITAEECEDIRSRVTWDACIPEALVRKAFPTPFARLAKLRLPVTFSTMSEYWHRHTGPSPVFPCVVESRMRPNGNAWRVRFTAEEQCGLFRAECPRHTLQVENGARMWAHVSYAFTGAVRRVIIPERIV